MEKPKRKTGGEAGKVAKAEQSDQTFRYPLELVATIAAQMLHVENYADAVRKARALIRECQRQEGNDTKTRGAVVASESRDPFAPCIPRDKALREMTNKDNATDATKCYRELRRFELPNEKDYFTRLVGDIPKMESKPAVTGDNLSEAIEARIAKELSDMEAKGVSWFEVERFKIRYRKQFPRRCPKPREKAKPRKKSLGGVSISENPK